MVNIIIVNVHQILQVLRNKIIEKNKTRFVLVFLKVYIVNFQHVNRYLVKIMEHVYPIVNEDFYVIVQEQVDRKIKIFFYLNINLNRL